MGILERIIQKLVTEFSLTPDELSSESHLINDIGCDSLDLAYLWYDFECDFGVLIPDDYQFSTIGSLAEKIEIIKETKYGSQEVSNPISDSRCLENSAENQFYCSFDVMLRVPFL